MLPVLWHRVTWGTGTQNSRNAFGVNWLDVGYIQPNGDKRNSFQLILTVRSDTGAGNFDIHSNYDQIQWETGEAPGGVDGLGGICAAVGFNAGSGNAPGTLFQLGGLLVPGSFVDTGSIPLIGFTNNKQPGQQLA